MTLYTGHSSPEVLEYLLKRRSAKAAELQAPGPDAAQMQTILSAAMRVPDHGRMNPWYFITFEGEARAQAGQIIADIYRRENPEATADKIALEQNRFMRAPPAINSCPPRLRSKSAPRSAFSLYAYVKSA